MSIKWPDEVVLPDFIGVGRVFNDDKSPCCAYGHFGQWTDGEGGELSEFQDAYVACGRQLLSTEDCVSCINDALEAPDRLLVYAASWLYLGVKIDRDWPEAEELARRAKG